MPTRAAIRFRLRHALTSIILLMPLVMQSSCSDGLTISGHYSSSFESSEFIPCNMQQRWWLTGNAEFNQRYHALAGKTKYASEPRVVFVRLQGELLGPGNYGHLGQYTHEYIVKQVLEMRPAAAGDCAPTD